ncbi:MAG: hypothetical protein LLF90_06995 [Methanomicrobiaceae archaeon]|uniref:hypothetical protein n=1 Tax=Methanoculleus sp. TaxID=90427 RepID=UPI00321137FC|nr:hypothetical protein [Methanomicrobiaceae archaeon]
MHYIVTDGAGFIGSNLADKVATRTSNAPTLFHGNITSCTSYSSSCPATGRISHLAVLEPQSMGTSYLNSITAS